MDEWIEGSRLFIERWANNAMRLATAMARGRGRARKHSFIVDHCKSNTWLAWMDSGWVHICIYHSLQSLPCLLQA